MEFVQLFQVGVSGLHKSISVTQSIHMGVVRRTWSYQKQFPIFNVQYVKAELSYDGDFGMWIATDRKKELIQLFQGVQQSGSWLLASKFSRPIRFFVFFNINITRMAWSFDFIVFKAVLYHVWNLTNKFWSLIDCGIYCICPFKSILLKLSQITQKVLLTSCLILTVRLEDFKISNSRTELWKSEYFRQTRHKISVLFRKLHSKHLLVQSQQYKHWKKCSCSPSLQYFAVGAWCRIPVSVKVKGHNDVE